MSIKELKILQSNIIRKNKKYNLFGLIIIGIIIVISVAVMLMNKAKLFSVLIIVLVEFTIFIIILTIIKNVANDKDIKIFYKEFKNVFVLKSLQRFFKNIKYKPEEGFSEKYIDDVVGAVLQMKPSDNGSGEK